MMARVLSVSALLLGLGLLTAGPADAGETAKPDADAFAAALGSGATPMSEEQLGERGAGARILRNPDKSKQLIQGADSTVGSFNAPYVGVVTPPPVHTPNTQPTISTGAVGVISPGL